MSPTERPNAPHSHDRRTGHRVYTPEQRTEYGKAKRKETPRSALGNFAPGPDRHDPIALLEEQGSTRLAQLVPIRYGRMAVSPFTFFRGAALPMAADLASMQRTGLNVQLCGDAHLLNFGAYGTPERRLVFDINDFDETSVGPFEWDVMRLCASLVLASRERGDSNSNTEKFVRAASAAYRESIAKFATMSTLDVWYSMFDVEKFALQVSKVSKVIPSGLRHKDLIRIRKRDSLFAVEKTTHEVDGVLRFISNPPLQVPADEFTQAGGAAAERSISDVINSIHDRASLYRRTLSPERRHLFDEYRIIDLARRVVGVGSVGTRCFIMLLIGRDIADPLILQVKEAQASVLERFAGKSPFDHHGERVVVGQKLTQSASDLFLGWTNVVDPEGNPRDYYIRQFRDWKASVEYAELSPPAFEHYAEICAWAVAKAHARSGDQIAISAYLGSGTAFDDAMVSFAFAYADQTVKDHAELLAAIESGRITAQSGI